MTKKKRGLNAKSFAGAPPRRAFQMGGKRWMPWSGALIAGAAGMWFAGQNWIAGRNASESEEVYHVRPLRTLTFNRDVAPIVFKNCSGCHRPGQSAPFNLLGYVDVKKRAGEIAKVTARRYMPPWLPEHAYSEFADERRLTVDELGIIQQWVAEGAAEGRPSDLPTPPAWDSDWQLGKPDLVVELPSYTLPASGKDVYRNFVAPIPAAGLRYVRGVEFKPGNAKVVHHAFVNVDETRRSRQFAERQSPPGFDGMELPETAIMPGGQLLGWQPGKLPAFAPNGLAWVLKPDTDLVLQAHLNPSGKREIVQPSVAFYFTDQAPTNRSFRLKLTALKLDIPAGEPNYKIQESYTLPVDAAVVRVGAHAHYLGRDLKGYATLPTGERKGLIWIKDWDFKWQGDYRYANSVWLPKGSRITLDYTYDNSAHNVRNPYQPPRRVRFGLQSADEMGELYFQILPRDLHDFEVLAKDFSQYFRGVSRDFYRFRVAANPNDAEAHKRLGRILGGEGAVDEAIAHLTEAIRLDPGADEPHYDLGGIYLRQGGLADAYREFSEVVRLNPNDFEAFGSLGIICLRAARNQEAEVRFEQALHINPQDGLARKYLDALRARR